MEYLRHLKDNDIVPGENLQTFNYLFKKNKINRIKFEVNSKSIWIFPYSKEEKEFSYEYTQPNSKFLQLISEQEAKEVLQEVNAITKKYFYTRFTYENSKEFPNFQITRFALFFIFLGFFLQLWRLFNLAAFDAYFNGDSRLIFYIFLIPWGIAFFIIIFMLFLFSKNKNVNYNTDLALYSEIDSLLQTQNQKNQKVQWTRGYQGLWIEVSKVNQMGANSNSKKNAKKISFNFAKNKNSIIQSPLNK